MAGGAAAVARGTGVVVVQLLVAARAALRRVGARIVGVVAVVARPVRCDSSGGERSGNRLVAGWAGHGLTRAKVVRLMAVGALRVAPAPQRPLRERRVSCRVARLTGSSGLRLARVHLLVAGHAVCLHRTVRLAVGQLHVLVAIRARTRSGDLLAVGRVALGTVGEAMRSQLLLGSCACTVAFSASPR